MTDMRKQAAAGIRPGDSWSVTRTFTEDDVSSFGRITKDYNPVHYDERFASVKGFKGRICHGLLTANLLCEIGGQLGWLAASMDFAFKKPVYFQDTVTCNLTVEDVSEKGFAKARAVFTNQNGEVVLEADLTGIIPGDGEKDVLKKMLEEGDPTNGCS